MRWTQQKQIQLVRLRCQLKLTLAAELSITQQPNVTARKFTSNMQFKTHEKHMKIVSYSEKHTHMPAHTHTFIYTHTPKHTHTFKRYFNPYDKMHF